MRAYKPTKLSAILYIIWLLSALGTTYKYAMVEDPWYIITVVTYGMITLSAVVALPGFLSKAHLQDMFLPIPDYIIPTIIATWCVIANWLLSIA